MSVSKMAKEGWKNFQCSILFKRNKIMRFEECSVFTSGTWQGPLSYIWSTSMQKFLSKLELFCLYLHRLSCYSKTLSMLITNYNKLGIHNVGFCYAIHYFMDKLVVCLWAVKRLYVSPNFFLIVEGQRTNYSIYLWAGSWPTLKYDTYNSYYTTHTLLSLIATSSN